MVIGQRLNFTIANCSASAVCENCSFGHSLHEIFSKCMYVHCMYFVLPPWLSWDILCLSDFIKDSLLWWTDILHISLKREGIGMAWSLFFFSSLLPNDFDLYYVQGVSHWNEQSKLALTDGQIEIFNFISWILAPFLSEAVEARLCYFFKNCLIKTKRHNLLNRPPKIWNWKSQSFHLAEPIYFGEHSYMTSDVFWAFLTYLPTLIRCFTT